jgi:hypothetical protein
LKDVAKSNSKTYPYFKGSYMLKELDTIVLAHDIPEHRLNRGDIGAVVHTYSNSDSYEIEFVNGRGRTVALVMLEAKDIRPMNPNEILHVREIRAA